MSDLDELVEVIVHSRDPDELYLRWSAGPEADAGGSSVDELTGIPLPGLSANALAVESWWDGRPFSLWVARKLYDYRHLREVRGPHVLPWVLAGRQVGRGPDNEPLVTCTRPVAWVDLRVVRQATHLVDEQAGQWGPMRRR